MSIPNKILVATDFSELGAAAVDQAILLARSFGSMVDVVHVFTLHNIPDSASYTRAELERAESNARVDLERIADRLRVGGLLGQAMMHFGDPAPLITLAADELHADMIVVGTHGRRGLSRLIMGSTAEEVLRQSHVPVLVVKEPRASKAQSRVDASARAAS